ncbi:MAG: hypothetical protein U9R50_01015 [Campylobacterota bacterium]|nr:hypothetical protein [Campylobacterota bacterium]
MGLLNTLKRKTFSAFRELFIYHHNSLEFRAKLFALIIAVNGRGSDEIFDYVKTSGMAIYNDETRADALLLATQEIISKVHNDNGLDEDLLVEDIVKEIKNIPRFRKKINTDQLRKLLEFTQDDDIRSYQENILEFLENAKEKN